MSFQRTRMSADRTLMSVIRTSLSLIGFGFTIFQFFEKMHAAEVLKSRARAAQLRSALVWLGIGGVGGRHRLSRHLHARLAQGAPASEGAGLIHADSAFPASMTLMVSILLLGIGVWPC